MNPRTIQPTAQVNAMLSGAREDACEPTLLKANHSRFLASTRTKVNFRHRGGHTSLALPLMNFSQALRIASLFAT